MHIDHSLSRMIQVSILPPIAKSVEHDSDHKEVTRVALQPILHSDC